MTSIFISYSSKDVEIAKTIQKCLEDEGFRIWRDERSIEILHQTASRQSTVLSHILSWTFQRTLLDMPTLRFLAPHKY